MFYLKLSIFSLGIQKTLLPNEKSMCNRKKQIPRKDSPLAHMLIFFNMPGVAGAFLQTPLSLIN